jgi:hypothetical protein
LHSRRGIIAVVVVIMGGVIRQGSYSVVGERKAVAALQGLGNSPSAMRLDALMVSLSQRAGSWLVTELLPSRLGGTALS